MDLGELCSVDDLTSKYDFMAKLECADSQLHKSLCYVERCFKLEEMLLIYRSFICDHFKSLIKLLLEKPNEIQFETFLIGHMERLNAILEYNK